MAEPDKNVEAARVVEESIRLVREATHAVAAAAASDKALEDLEAAWEAWSAGIQGCDERTMILLRAAFEAGVAARPEKA